MRFFLTNLFSICFFLSIVAQTDSVSIEAQWSAKEETFTNLYYDGKYKEALVDAREMLEWTAQKVSKEDILYAKSLNNLGQALNWLGKNKEAIETLEESKAYFVEHSLENNDYYPEILNNLGMTYKDVGIYEKALPLLKENIGRFKTIYGENHFIVGIGMNNLALVYEDMLQYQKAIEIMQEAVALTEKTEGKDHFRYILRSSNLGALYTITRQFSESLVLLEDVVKRGEKMSGKEHPDYISPAYNLAKTYAGLGKNDMARDLIDDVLQQSIVVYGKEHKNYGVYLNFSARLHAKNNEFVKALDEINTVLSLYENQMGKNHSFYLQALSNKILYLEQTQQLKEAVKEAETANEIMTWLLKNQFSYFSEQAQNSLMIDLKNTNVCTQSFAYRHPEIEELGAVVYHQNLLLKEALRNNYKNLIKTIRRSDSEEIQANANEWEALKIQLSQQYNLPIKKRMSQLDSLEQKANELEGQLAQSTQRFRENQEAVHWQDVQASLEADEVAIEFSHFEYQETEKRTDSVFYVAYVLTKDASAPQIIRLFEAAEIGSLKATRSLYSPEKMGHKPHLKNLVWQALADVLKDKKTIYFSPSGVLHRINFGAIPIHEKETIADRFQLHQLGSTRQVAFQKEEDIDLKNAFVYGGIQYDLDSTKIVHNRPTHKVEKVFASRSLVDKFRSYRGDNWDYLPFTKTETERIERLLKKKGISVQLQSGDMATEESFKALGNNHISPSLIHLATHGYFFSRPKKDAQIGVKATDNPLVRSGLILAGANRIWKGGEVEEGQEDGVLTAYEIAQMDLSNTGLVVLSACETGLGDIEGSEGVYGLQRAFNIAGTKYVLMSLWKVRDEQTQEFMSAFYEAWLNEGMAIPKAFQTAQGVLKAKYAAPFNPRLWAGFVLVQ